MKKTDIKGFSLMEIMIVLAIIGVLILAVSVNFSGAVSKAKATEAKTNLHYIYTLQKSHYIEYSRYSESLEDLGFQPAKPVTQGGSASYEFETVQAGPTGFKVRATAVVDFNQNGQFNVWEIDQDNNLVETVKD